MNSRELITRVIEFDRPARIGWDFGGGPSDLRGCGVRYDRTERLEEHRKWGYHEELLKQVPHFKGLVYEDEWGNIWGRLDGASKGEVVRGVLEDGFDRLGEIAFPHFVVEDIERLKEARERHADKFLMGGLPGFTFNIMRKMRRMENFLMDTLLAKDEITKLGAKIESMLAENISFYCDAGFDAILFGEDWGSQEALLISPPSWRELFAPSFRRLCGQAHEGGLKVMMHSCGNIAEIIPDLIEVGVDVLQLDQPGLFGLEYLSQYSGKVTFWSPVDIQKVMPTGNRELIEKTADDMMTYLGKGGGFIAKDYPQWDVLGVKPEWVKWAKDRFLAHSY
ncbi:MAG: uroporphyrinogen decarboxylase family protein [Limnochordia bacterium]|nr:uroporphyrinogen decarboxylase family protein [Limnochordia bacterium]